MNAELLIPGVSLCWNCDAIPKKIYFIVVN